ncbi:hypothetical protein [Deinococcus fonticola]|uniref:hypothetical protein n=1 Tax=Deinococcus fonticola TaxID=2528713 RepID=UPI00142F4B45|nr:hypothetical protein [Deinococcus fonticola]
MTHHTTTRGSAQPIPGSRQQVAFKEFQHPTAELVDRRRDVQHLQGQALGITQRLLQRRSTQ